MDVDVRHGLTGHGAILRGAERGITGRPPGEPIAAYSSSGSDDALSERGNQGIRRKASIRKWAPPPRVQHLYGHGEGRCLVVGLDGAAYPLRELPQVTDFLLRQLREALDHPPRADQDVACAGSNAARGEERWQGGCKCMRVAN